MASEMFITDLSTMREALRAARPPEQANAMSCTEYEQKVRAEKNRLTYGDYYINELNRITKEDL